MEEVGYSDAFTSKRNVLEERFLCPDFFLEPDESKLHEGKEDHYEAEDHKHVQSWNKRRCQGV